MRSKSWCDVLTTPGCLHDQGIEPGRLPRSSREAWDAAADPLPHHDQATPPVARAGRPKKKPPASDRGGEVTFN